jgi:Carboxypeptidase regulatory-like domain
MHRTSSLVKRATLLSSVTLIVFSTYSAPVITSASIQTYTISGTVSAEKCPINPAMGMPCTLSPAPGCTVSISPVYATAGPGIYNLPNIWIRNAVTDTNGSYSITFDAQAGLIVDVTAAKAGAGAATPVEVSLVNQSTTVNPVLQNVAITPPPAQGTATLQGTVYVTSCPPATTPPMGMPCSRNSVPQCTVVVAPTAVPMLYPVPPQYLPHITVTDAGGRYSLDIPAGDYIVKAQKTGYGFAQAAVTLTANQTSTLDLTLAAKDTLSVSSTGTASVQGTIKEIINPPNASMGMVSVVQPVAGCTVLVCAAIMPILYAEGAGENGSGAVSSTESVTAASAPAILVDRQYITITDSNGHYSFKDIPLYGKTYSVVLMAKKGQKFGYTQADLANGQTKTVDIIISEAAVVMTDTAAFPPDMYQSYYAATVKTLSPENPAAITTHFFPSNSSEAIVRISGNRLLINLLRGQRLTIKAFTLSGKEIVAFADNRFFGADKQVIPITARYSGPVLIKVQGENVSYTVKVTRIK